jgi:PAS domain S-box-containing protein
MTMRSNQMLQAFVLTTLVTLLPAGVLADAGLDSWHAKAEQVRRLAENDIPAAYKEALQLQSALPLSASTAERVQTFNLLARIEVYLGETGAAERHAKEAFDLALQNNDRAGQVEADLNIALNTVNQARFDAMSEAVKHSMDILVGVDRPDLQSEAMLRTSMMFRRFERFDDSVEVAMQAMEIAKRSNSPMALVYAYQGMAIAYDFSGHYAEARDYYTKMRSAAQDAHSRLQEGDALIGLGSSIAGLGDAKSGERLIRDAIHLYRKAGGPFYLAHGLYTLADNLRKQRRLVEAQAVISEAVAIYENKSNKVGLWWALNLRSQNSKELRKIVEARADADRAYTLAKAIGHPLYLSESVRMQSVTAAEAGDFEQAYRLSVETAELSTKSARERAAEHMLELAKRFENESHQRQIDELTRSNQMQGLHQRWLWTMLAASMVLLVISGLFLLYLRRSRADVRKLNIELEHRVDERTAELRQSRQSLAEAQRIAHMGSWELDLVTDKLKWSEEIYRIFEIDPAQFGASYEAFLNTVHPDDRQRVDRTFAESVRNHTPYDIEHRLLFPDGSIKYVHERCETFYKADGKASHSLGMVQDITERKHMEEALAVRERNFRSLAENLPDNIARWDTHGRYLYINPTHAHTLGISVDDIAGRELPDTHDRVKAALAQVVATGQAIASVRQPALVDGEIQIHEVSLAPEYDAEGRIVSVVGLGRNMTEMYRMQDAIAAREHELRSLAESSPGMMGSFYLRPDGTVCMPYVSSNIHELFGLYPQDVVEDASSLMSLNHPDDAQRVRDTIAESARTLTPWHCEYRIRHPEKGERWMEGNTNPQSHPDGGTIWYGYVHDITERKRMEAELVASRNFLDSVIDSVSDPIFVKDRQHRWSLLNDAFCTFIGRPRDTLVGKSDYDFFSKEQADVFWAKDEFVFDSGKVNLNEESFTSANGEEHYIQTKKTPFIAGDGREMLVGVIRDITERKRYEAAREAALAEARRLADLRSEFIAHMSHELRTPLNGILGYAQILGHDAKLDEMQHASVDVIRHSGEHLLALIEDILDLARIESGRLELDIGDIPLAQFLDVVADMVGVRAKLKNLEFVCEFAPDLPQGIRGDEKRLRQVLLNLLSNAVKFTDQGKITLRVGRITPSRLAIAIADTGIGIASSDRESIFQSFEQVSDAQHRIGGTGLGLAISRQLVRLMGGDIGVESRPGAGSTFRFELELPDAGIEPEILRAFSAGTQRMDPGRADEPGKPLPVLPQEEMRQLYRLAQLGNMRDIAGYAEHIAGFDPSYRPFAEHVKRLASSYQSKAILAFVEGYLI